MAHSAQQEAALRAVTRWLADPAAPQVFRLFGLAGTGKTTIAKRIAQDARRAVAFAAFTGKAALVLTQKGCPATTIHSLLYVPFEGEDGKVRFRRKRVGEDEVPGLFIIDECSMVDARLGRDLLALGARVLVLGDPFQLPPVMGAGFFTEHEPDVLLTEIHRQARDNPIVALADAVRNGRSVGIGRHGDSEVVRLRDADPGAVLAADQVLVGRNATRRAFNRNMRAARGLADPLPVVGDRLVCLRNDAEKGLLNGGLWRVHGVRRDAEASEMVIDSLDVEGMASVRVLHEFFGDAPGLIARIFSEPLDEFDYGYALTVHKAQGSQWGSVVLRDESGTFGAQAARWLYTGITRAAQKVTVIV